MFQLRSYIRLNSRKINKDFLDFVQRNDLMKTFYFFFIFNINIILLSSILLSTASELHQLAMIYYYILICYLIWFLSLELVFIC